MAAGTKASTKMVSGMHSALRVLSVVMEMPVKAEHAPHIVHVGQTVTFTMGQHFKELAGKSGVVIGKHLRRDACGDGVNVTLAYHIRVTPPMLGLPETAWCWRCGFEVR